MQVVPTAAHYWGNIFQVTEMSYWLHVYDPLSGLSLANYYFLEETTEIKQWPDTL